jgi:hypothetical protein
MQIIVAQHHCDAGRANRHPALSEFFSTQRRCTSLILIMVFYFARRRTTQCTRLDMRAVDALSLLPAASMRALTFVPKSVVECRLD